MENTTTSKKEYITKWNEYIEGLSILMLCKDEDLSKQIRDTIEHLKELVPQIADKKENLKDE